MTKFTKMHGCGNDFIYFDCFGNGENINDPQIMAVKLSDRNKSIGGDGIVLIMPSAIADAKMRMFNADGSEGLMCGNSIRCVGKYLHDRGLVNSLDVKIETVSGIKELTLIQENGEITAAKVNMGPAILEPEKVPVNLSGGMIVARQVNISGISFEITCVSMGNPHAIIFNDDIDLFDLPGTGAMFENSELFPEGINLGVVQTLSRSHLRMRVWERGGGETLASGTSACAAAVSAVLMGYSDKNSDIKVDVAGGTLTVNYTCDAVFMTGDCVTIYEGMVKI